MVPTAADSAVVSQSQALLGGDLCWVEDKKCGRDTSNF